MYFILLKRINDTVKDAIFQGRSLYLERLGVSFEDGLDVSHEIIRLPIVFRLDKYALRGNMTDHLYINAIPGPILSNDVKEFFQKEGIKNIEYYQLTLIDEFYEPVKHVAQNLREEEKKTVEYKNYSIANVVGLVDCVDHEKSILEYFYPPELRNPPEDMLPAENDENNPFAGENPNDIDFVTKIVLDESKIDPALKIFRLLDKPSLLLFHESIVKRLREEEATGFVFVPVEDYTEVIPDDNSTAVNEEQKLKDIYQIYQGKEYSKEEWRSFLMSEAGKKQQAS